MSAKRAPPSPRRTQEQRREGTIRKVLDAATDTLIELGYSGSTIQAICARAEVSQGGLFRHFATREALLVAVGEDVGRKILGRYRDDLEAIGAREDRLFVAMSLVRDHCRSRLNQAWYELSVACRTSPALKRALAPVAARYHDDIERLARELLPEVAASLGDRFPVLVDTITAIFDGEALRGFVHPSPAIEAARPALLFALMSPLLPARTAKLATSRERPRRSRAR